MNTANFNSMTLFKCSHYMNFNSVGAKLEREYVAFIFEGSISPEKDAID